MTQISKDQLREFLISYCIDNIVRLLVQDKGYSLEQALDKVYRSETIKKMRIPEGELYVQSPLCVYELLLDEIAKRDANVSKS